MEFTCLASGESWVLTNIYASCTDEGRTQFLDLFKGIDMPDTVDWLIVGDFTLTRYPENRNKPGGDINNMMVFNEAISQLAIEEIPLHGQRFTWSNKQENPLLQRLDWFFTSASWMLKYPETIATTLSRDTSNHVPCLISIKTQVPKAKVLRFENFWMQHNQFEQVLQHAWSVPVTQYDAAKSIVAKLKNIRRIFKEWSKLLPGLAKTIISTKQVISFLDILEESRDLSLQEWNFRAIVQEHLNQLLQYQQRETIKWVKFGDECIEFFHATASVKHRRSVITSLVDGQGVTHISHEEKADLL